jgi:hypothetical protein
MESAGYEGWLTMIGKDRAQISKLSRTRRREAEATDGYVEGIAQARLGRKETVNFKIQKNFKHQASNSKLGPAPQRRAADQREGEAPDEPQIFSRRSP